MTKKDKILQKIKDVVFQTAPKSDVYLYGSRARGNAKRFSDWDILILLNQPKISFENETKFMDAFYEIELETGEIISPLIYTKKDWTENYSFTPLYKNVIKEGYKIA